MSVLCVVRTTWFLDIRWDGKGAAFCDLAMFYLTTPKMKTTFTTLLLNGLYWILIPSLCTKNLNKWFIKARKGVRESWSQIKIESVMEIRLCLGIFMFKSQQKYLLLNQPPRWIHWLSIDFMVNWKKTESIWVKTK